MNPYKGSLRFFVTAARVTEKAKEPNPIKTAVPFTRKKRTSIG